MTSRDSNRVSAGGWELTSDNSSPTTSKTKGLFFKENLTIPHPNFLKSPFKSPKSPDSGEFKTKIEFYS